MANPVKETLILERKRSRTFFARVRNNKSRKVFEEIQKGYLHLREGKEKERFNGVSPGSLCCLDRVNSSRACCLWIPVCTGIDISPWLTKKHENTTDS